MYIWISKTCSCVWCVVVEYSIGWKLYINVFGRYIFGDFCSWREMILLGRAWMVGGGFEGFYSSVHAKHVKRSSDVLLLLLWVGTGVGGFGYIALARG